MLGSILITTVIAFSPMSASAFPGSPRSFFEFTADFNRPAVERIQDHLAFVEYVLRLRDGSTLSPEQRRKRGLCLESLRTYRERGQFPQPDSSVASPIFVDATGTACAVGHLMITSGAGRLAGSIAEQSNRAYIMDLAHRSDVADWATEQGLTLQECALIQPTYCNLHGMPTMTAETVGHDIVISWVPHDNYSAVYISFAFFGQWLGTFTVPPNPTRHTLVDMPWGDYYFQLAGACHGWPGPQFADLTFEHQPLRYVRGDTNVDGFVDIADAIAGFDFLFSSGVCPCEAALDVNGDGSLNIADPIHLVAFVFGATAPTLPFPHCAEDEEAVFGCLTECP